MNKRKYISDNSNAKNNFNSLQEIKKIKKNKKNFDKIKMKRAQEMKYKENNQEDEEINEHFEIKVENEEVISIGVEDKRKNSKKRERSLSLQKKKNKKIKKDIHVIDNVEREEEIENETENNQNVNDTEESIENEETETKIVSQKRKKSQSLQKREKNKKIKKDILEINNVEKEEYETNRDHEESFQNEVENEEFAEDEVVHNSEEENVVEETHFEVDILNEHEGNYDKKQDEDNSRINDDEDLDDTNSAFHLHFNINLPKVKEPEVETHSNWNRKCVEWPHLGRLRLFYPVVKPIVPKKVKLLLEDEESTELPLIGMPDAPQISVNDILKKYLEKPLCDNVNPKTISGLQSEMLTILSNYNDFYYNEATFDKWDTIRKVIALHCLNHVFKSRKQIKRNNKELKLLEKEDGDIFSKPFKDRGFTRPKVLILLPFKHSAYKLIKFMITYSGLEVVNKKKFKRDFGPPTEDKPKRNTKPESFYKIFEGDISEDFRIGISINKKCIKLYEDLLRSDIIIASPLGMRCALENASRTEQDVLSSIEVFVLDQADIMSMQNWQHVTIIRDTMNSMPKDFHALDFDGFRVHGWHYDKLARYYRQTLIFASVLTSVVRGTLGVLRNFTGKIEVYNRAPGVIFDTKVRVRLVFMHVKLSDPLMAGHFAYFQKEILPLLREHKDRVLIYVPEYADYLRLVLFFKNDGGTSVSTINEYMLTEVQKIAKARSLFFDGKRKFIIYTERLHFYKRYKIKGVRHVLFYTVPTFPEFFKEICDLTAEEYQNPRLPFTGTSRIYLPHGSSHGLEVYNLVGDTRKDEIFKAEHGVNAIYTRH